ncbi:MAG: hypothetical protein MnENMB40S_06780 [Rhizobiaceae bacterium MnEN-MB40S]|nr:MAG: hypothetical protein MnENMB40S_06780 [Rhizobiaceae bacterium MnEN-MB40S]
MTQSDIKDRSGIDAPFPELVRCRPDRRVTGFAPSGKVRTHQFGTNHSVFRGRGMEFDESRAYQPGDDVRSIDWRVTARTGSLHTKLFHEERERPVLILLDLRSSMRFGTRRQFKSSLASGVAARLAWTGIDGGDRVGGFINAPGGVQVFPASRNRAAMLRFLKAVSEHGRIGDAGEEPESPLYVTIDRMRKASRPGTLVFVISDFADFDDRCERSLKRISLHAHVTNILIHDPLDAALPINGGQKISDGQSVTALSAIGRSGQKKHADSFESRRSRLKVLCSNRGMAFLDLATGDEADEALHPHRRNARARSNSRRKAA